MQFHRILVISFFYSNSFQPSCNLFPWPIDSDWVVRGSTGMFSFLRKTTYPFRDNVTRVPRLFANKTALSFLGRNDPRAMDPRLCGAVQLHNLRIPVT